MVLSGRLSGGGPQAIAWPWSYGQDTELRKAVNRRTILPMVLVMVGASHHDVPLEGIESLAHAGKQAAKALVASCPEINGAVVLSTCNRYELYLDASRFHEAIDAATTFLTVRATAGIAHGEDFLRVRVGIAVAQHLYSVTSGLESMVIGEDEVAGQVRGALATAQRQGTTTAPLERLMQRALATSKSVTNSTGLGAAGRSIVTVGLDLVEQRHGELGDKHAVVIGTGAYARVVVAALQRRGCSSIAVHSTSGRAQAFAHSHHIQWVPTDALPQAVAEADIVVACSGALVPVIDVQAVSARTSAQPLPIIDLALSPDVDDRVRSMESVDVIDLHDIGRHAPAEHASAILEAQQIVEDAVADFEQAETGREADPAVVAMRAYVTTIVNSEIARAERRLEPEAAQEVARALHRVSNALLHTPSVRAQELARNGDFTDYRKAMHTLFGIEIDLAVAPTSQDR